jgi:hypothetical protein
VYKVDGYLSPGLCPRYPELTKENIYEIRKYFQQYFDNGETNLKVE